MSVSLDLSRCSSQSAFAQMKSRQLYWLSGTLLSFEWEGRLQCARERFNLKSVQLTAEHSRCSSVCVCARCAGGGTLTCSTISSNQNSDSASMSHLFEHIAAGLPIMSTKILKLYSRPQKWTSLLPETHNAYTHTLVTNRGPIAAPSGAVVEQVVSPMACILKTPGANREIVPLSQEPGHKDRKWNPSTWYHSTAGPRGRNISAWRPWWICCCSQNVFT